MRRVFAEPVSKEVSAIGFGCASLGSRVAATEGLIALARAYDQGVNWFDVAPPYGDGAAEALLGQFLKGKRDHVVICTKFGIEPPNLTMKARLLKPVMRAALNVAPQLREVVASRRPTALHAPIEPQRIEASVTRSLRNLGVDQVDVLAMHEPLMDEVRRDDVLGILQRIIEKGYARVIAIAGDRATTELGIADFPIYRIAQHADGPFARPLSPVNALRVTHSIFGVGGALSRLIQALNSDENLRSGLAAFGYTGPNNKIAAAALMDFALSNNATGVVLASMFHSGHLDFNINRASRSPNPELVALLQGHNWTVR